MSLIKRMMDKWLCCHDWEHHVTDRIKDDCNRVIELRETLICKKCGKIKQIML